MPKVGKVSKEETEQLIELVRENAAIYDQSCADYSNNLFITNACMGSLIGKNGEHCLAAIELVP